MKAKLPDFDSLVKEATTDGVSFERLLELSQKNLDLAHVLAANPASPPDLLEIMARRRDNIILANVTANPNTPTQVLCQLGKKFPVEFLKNPILPLLLLENPNFFQQIPSNTLSSLCDYVLEHCYSEKGIPKQEIYSSLAPREVLQQLINSEDSMTRFSIAKHPNTPLAVLEQLAISKHENARYGVALNPNTPVYLLEKFVVDKSFHVRSGVAQNPNIPIKAILKLANDPNSEVSRGVFFNSQAPAQILDALLKKFSEYQNGAWITWVASSYGVNPYVLEKLSTSDIHKLRIHVARNRKTPPETLKKMALVQNEHRLVLREIAKNIATPYEVLQHLASEPRITIKEAALDNICIPDEVKASWLNWKY
ncbi:hypothetical protein NIES4071_44540 [Calothrix sp. NIES-4071]|nr:hypothetical protein NIES4071_44540 [Calothrix sp. NIES-4071]BAZ58767.1 hypothetical protein NIES4105_44470 [Calothrix sp. NIES-4105]